VVEAEGADAGGRTFRTSWRSVETRAVRSGRPCSRSWAAMLRYSAGWPALRPGNSQSLVPRPELAQQPQVGVPGQGSTGRRAGWDPAAGRSCRFRCRTAGSRNSRQDRPVQAPAGLHGSISAGAAG